MCYKFDPLCHCIKPQVLCTTVSDLANSSMLTTQGVYIYIYMHVMYLSNMKCVFFTTSMSRNLSSIRDHRIKS